MKKLVFITLMLSALAMHGQDKVEKTQAPPKKENRFTEKAEAARRAFEATHRKELDELKAEVNNDLMRVRAVYDTLKKKLKTNRKHLIKS